MYAAGAIPLKNGRLATLGLAAYFQPTAEDHPARIASFLVESTSEVTFLAESFVIRLNGAQVRRALRKLGEEVAPLDTLLRALGEFPAFLEWAGGQ